MNLIKLRSGGGEPYENQGLALWDKQYLSNSGWASNILKFQNWGRHSKEPETINQDKEKKKHFFKDFDEFHNFGLELQTKAKGKIITNNVSLIHLYNTCYITLTQFSY